MLYLIDGHNLIPKIPGINLKMVDDENELVKLLQIFARIKRARVEVYFDGALSGYSGSRPMGMVMAHYVRKGIPADKEIIYRLQKIKKSPQGTILVTSDRQIRIEAQSVKIKAMLSEDFAEMLINTLREDVVQDGSDNLKLPGNDLDEWLKLFGEKP